MGLASPSPGMLSLCRQSSCCAFLLHARPCFRWARPSCSGPMCTSRGLSSTLVAGWMQWTGRQLRKGRLKAGDPTGTGKTVSARRATLSFGASKAWQWQRSLLWRSSFIPFNLSNTCHKACPCAKRSRTCGGLFYFHLPPSPEGRQRFWAAMQNAPLRACACVQVLHRLSKMCRVQRGLSFNNGFRAACM